MLKLTYGNVELKKCSGDKTSALPLQGWERGRGRGREREGEGVMA